MSIDYVCGFAYAPRSTVVASTTHVLLLRKSKPAWQAGKLNGVGGKVEIGETASHAMVREFFEETGIQSQMADWAVFHQERFVDGSRVFFFHAVLRAVDLQAAVERTGLTEEPCSVIEIASVTGVPMTRSKHPLMHNLRYLLCMSRTYMTMLDEGDSRLMYLPVIEASVDKCEFDEVQDLRQRLRRIDEIVRGTTL